MKGDVSGWQIEDSLAELEQLSSTAQLEIVGQTYQKLERVDPGTYIGKGKLDEIHTWLAELQFDLLVFDDEPHRGSNATSRNFSGSGADRTALILDISHSMPTPVRAPCRWSCTI